MSDARARLVAFAPGRQAWSTRCARWSADARIPFAYARCVSLSALVDELSHGTPHAVLLDARTCTPQVLAATTDANVPIIAVGGDVSGAHGQLDDTFRRDELLQVLVLLQRAVTAVPVADEVMPLVQRRLVAVIGAGGAGTSTVAALVAQGLAHSGASVLLADLCRNASQAVLHDVKHTIDGVMEMAAATPALFGGAEPYRPSVPVDARGYALVLGMRQPLQWVALRGERARQVVATLRDGEGWLVCDIDADLDTEQDTGSIGVGDRHRFTTDVLAQCAAVVVVADASLMGVFRGVELCAAVARFCGEAVPVVVVINRVKKGDALRPSARFSAAFEALTAAHQTARKPTAVVTVPVFAADRCHLEVRAFPHRMATHVTGPLTAVLAGEA